MSTDIPAGNALKRLLIEAFNEDGTVRNQKLVDHILTTLDDATLTTTAQKYLALVAVRA